MENIKIILADLHKPILAAWQAIGQDKNYVTTYQGSIFEVDCDALVSPANSFGFMDGGIDMAISRFFGWQVQERLQQLIQAKYHGELLVGQADIVATDHSRIPYVIAAPTMRVPMILSDSPNIYLALRAVLLLAKHGQLADGTPVADQVQTIAWPGMGTGIGQVSPEIFARQMKQALEDIVEGRYTYPKSWWEAAQRHQLLYSGPDEIRDLQVE